jgi:hypothetical protein
MAGDAINVVLCGARQNLRLILNHLRIMFAQIRWLLAARLYHASLWIR